MCLSLRQTVFVATLLVISLPPVVRAQVLPIAWSVKVAPGAIHQGQQFTALVRAQIPFSWHLYSTTQPPGGPMATTFVVSGPAFGPRGTVTAREPDRAFDAIAGMKTETYADSVTFRVPVVASRAGKQTLEVRVKYQSCTDRFCAPQKIESVRTVVTVAPPAPAKR